MLKISWNTGFNKEYYNLFFKKVKHSWDLLPGDINFYIDENIHELTDDPRIVNFQPDLKACPTFLSGIEIKFWKKSRSIVQAIKNTKETHDYCIWLDADVKVNAVPIIEELIPRNNQLISVNNKIVNFDKTIDKWKNPYLKDLGLDTGFIAINLKHDQIENFLLQYENFWNTDEIKEFVRKYDTYVLDRIINKNNFEYLNLWNGCFTGGKKYCGFEDSNLEKYFYHYWGKKQKANLNKDLQ